jgi:nucleoside-triphosphatase THEP1
MVFDLSMDKKIIALTGAKTVGKTTMAKSLQSWAIDSEVLSFATPIKEMLWQMGISYENLHEKKEEVLPDYNQSARQLMCSLGTEWGRDMVHKDIWVFAMKTQVERAGSSIIIIDDCRFENEARWIRSVGGRVINLVREAVSYEEGHSSETPLSCEFIDRTVKVDNFEEGLNQLMDETEQLFYI